MTLLYIILATAALGLISFVGAVFFGLRLNVRRITFYLISFASGTMLGVAFLHLIPESIEHGERAYLMIPAGVFVFFIFEKFLIWRHCHHHQRPEDHQRPVAATMVLIGDAVHNFIDGIIVAGAFMTDPSIGVSVTLAILLHEIPQELGDFGSLIHGGLSVKRALAFNALSATTAIVGGVLAYGFFSFSASIQAAILPIAAGGFLYIALADLIPQLHQHTTLRQAFAQIVLIAGGFGAMTLMATH